jgi:hypothetical protein
LWIGSTWGLKTLKVDAASGKTLQAFDTHGGHEQIRQPDAALGRARPGGWATSIGSRCPHPA